MGQFNIVLNPNTECTVKVVLISIISLGYALTI